MSTPWAKLSLPEGWEEKYDFSTRKFFYVDHKLKKTTWVDPRIQIYNQQNKLSMEEECSDNSSQCDDSGSSDSYSINMKELYEDYPEFSKDKIKQVLLLKNFDKKATKDALDMEIINLITNKDLQQKNQNERLKKEELEKKHLQEIQRKEQEEKQKRETDYQKRMEEEDRIKKQMKLKEQLEERRIKAEQEMKKEEEIRKKAAAEAEKRRLEDQRREKEQKETYKTEKPTTSNSSYSNNNNKTTSTTKSNKNKEMSQKRKSPFYSGPSQGLAKGPDPCLRCGPNLSLVSKKENLAKGTGNRKPLAL